MSASDRIRILVVDDLQEKLLVYRTILDSTSLEIVTATSGPEALRQVLQNDFAVILLDVNMPGMDGYDTAAMIRKRKRSAHTPIIFITAYADELHALKGYAYGAVDYVLSPVAPDVLRTKVRVFTDLYRLNQQVREQAAQQVAQSEKERARLAAVLNRTSDAFIHADASGAILHINPAGVNLLGYDVCNAPPASLEVIGVKSEQLNAAMREGIWFGDSALATFGGEGVAVSQLLLAHFDQVRNVESFSLIARDIRERQRAEQARGHLAAIVESSDDAIISMTLEGRITTWNAGAQRLFGHTAEQAIGEHVTMLIPKERVSEEEVILERIRSGQRVLPFETVRVARDGRPIDVSLTVSPLRDTDGGVIGASKVARDITARKQNEAELVRHRSHLEDLVRERTNELQESHERLRLADRLASIGTLAAGLGHDMGNLLLPIRARIASLEVLDLPAAARDHIQAIKTAGEYLKRLSQGLRLFALDPTEAATGAATNLSAWWQDVEPFLRNALPKSTVVEAVIPDGVPAIGMPPHTFTQVIYNLVQNAGQCMQDQPHGVVRISARTGGSNGQVIITVADNGPGMSEDVRQRCMEPFFTTRKRGISTGLGLALVRGAVCNVSGSVEIESTPGEGTTFRLTLPCAVLGGHSPASASATGEAWVDVADVRVAAYVTSLLRGMGMQVHSGLGEPSRLTRLIVLNVESEMMEALPAILDQHPRCRVVIFGERPATQSDNPQTLWLEERSTPSQMRAALYTALRPATTPLPEVAQP